MKKIIIYIMSMVMCVGLMTSSIYATSKPVNEMSHAFVGFDENGNLIQYDTNELEEEVADASSSQISMATLEDEKAITYGVVNFRVKGSIAENTYYTNCANNDRVYINGYTISDGAYLGMVNGKVKFKAAGVTGLVDPSDVQILDYSEVKTLSTYEVENGKLYHYVAKILTKSSDYFSVNLLGDAPSYLNANTSYYSYDGHYFYTDFKTMINDYKNNVYTHAVNANTPYYNYFMYLPCRSKTSLTAAQLDQYTASIVSSGKLLNAGDNLISNQNKYGVNALIMYANAVMESGWGQSQIAIDKNNLFGHGAADDNPYYGANGYGSVDECILYHAKVVISEGFCDPKDYAARYYGSHIGDKESGINVKYGSDPYWGEKIAHVCFSVQAAYGGHEVNKYTLGIANGGINVYSNPGSNVLYNSGSISAYPLILLGKENGYYKVQSDATLNKDRTSITQDSGAYDFDAYYAYVKADSVYALADVKTETGTNKNQWVKDSSGNWYWYDGSGKYVTGWKQIGSNWYYFNASGIMQKNQWIDHCYVDGSGVWQMNRWMKSDGKWWYRYGDGTYPVSKFLTIGSSTYYFNAKGYVVTGWKEIQGKWYYFNDSGAMAKGQWVNNSYLEQDGTMATNKWIGNCYVDSNGLWTPSKWVLQNGKYWYRHQDGSYTKNGFELIYGQWYLFDKNGYMLTGWQDFENERYYFKNSGAMVKNTWVNNYYLGSNGKMAKDKWIGDYYVDKDGKLATSRWVGKYYVDSTGLWIKDSWMKTNGKWWYRYGDGQYPIEKFDVIAKNTYYFDEEGYMVTGWQTIGKDRYYFDASGIMVKEQWIDDCYLDAYGKMAKSQWIQDRYVGEDGKWIPNYS